MSSKVVSTIPKEFLKRTFRLRAKTKKTFKRNIVINIKNLIVKKERSGQNNSPNFFKRRIKSKSPLKLQPKKHRVLSPVAKVKK